MKDRRWKEEGRGWKGRSGKEVAKMRRSLKGSGRESVRMEEVSWRWMRIDYEDRIEGGGEGQEEGRERRGRGYRGVRRFGGNVRD